MVIKKFLCLAVLLLALHLANSCDLNINERPMVKEEPTLVKSVANGEKYVIGDLSDP